MSTVYIKKNSNFAEVISFYKKVNGEWSGITQQDFIDYTDEKISDFGGVIPSVYKFEIAAPESVTAETVQCLALLNNVELTTGVTWLVVGGGEYASINQDGLITIDTAASASNVTVQASYSSFYRIY